MTTFAGGCLCGAVAFAIDAPTKWCAHCHCSMCRRAHGAPFVTWIGVVASQFRWVKGEDHLARYHSSADATRSFCRDCGSMLTFESSRWSDEVHIARAQVAGEIDRFPAAHCFFDDKAPWVAIHDDLKRLGGPSGTQPI